MIEAEAPDIVFLLHDLWVFEHFSEVFAPVRDQAIFVGYIPLDGAIRDEGLAKAVRGLDLAIVYTDWAAREMDGALSRLQALDPAAARPMVGVVPHGVDTAVFNTSWLTDLGAAMPRAYGPQPAPASTAPTASSAWAAIRCRPVRPTSLAWSAPARW